MGARRASWKSKTQLESNSPVLTDVEILGEGDDAYIELEKSDTDSYHVPFTDPLNFDYDDTKIIVADGKARLKEAVGAGDQDNFPYTTPANYQYDPGVIEVGGGKASLLNQQVADSHDWPYTDINNHTVSPPGSIDIVAGKAKLHDQGSSTQNDDVDYNTPANYTFDPAKIESIDKGGGNKAFRLKGGAGSAYANWHLNELEGSDAVDSSGNGRDGTLINMEDEDWKAGKLNNCLEFDGVDERVDCGDIAGFDSDEPFSVEFWLYNLDYSRNMCYVTKGQRTTTFAGWSLYTYNQGKLHVHLLSNFGAGNYIQVKTNITIWDPQWYHIVVTYDGSSTAAGIHIYVDNVDVALTVVKDALTSSMLTATPCQIGGWDSQLHFKGRLDEVVIYDTELSAEDVEYRWNEGNGIEDTPGGFDTSDPTVVSDYDSAFGTVLQWKDYEEAVDTPTGTEVKYNISIDSGVTWKYWDGDSWETSDGTYAQANTAVEIDTNIYLLGVGNQRFRLKAFLHSEGTNTPELDNVNVVWYEIMADFITDGRITTDIEMDETPETLWSWESFVETVLEPANTEIRHALSNDSGANWQYWNGSIWTASNGLSWSEFSTGADIVANIGTFTKTNAKLKVRSYLKTTDSATSPELNNLQINYKYGYNYSLTDPLIKALFDVGSGAGPLNNWEGFVETVTTPANTAVKYLLSDDEGASWKYWNGSSWAVSDLSYGQTNTAAEINTNILTFPVASKTLRVAAYLHTDDAEATPEVDNILVTWVEEPISYPVGSFEISMNTDIQPPVMTTYLEAIETVTKPTGTDIKYQYSINEGASYNGSWLSRTELEDAIKEISCAKDGTDTLRIKFQLSTTDSQETPEMDNLEISMALGYKLEGVYESYQYLPHTHAVGIYVERVTYDIELPDGSTTATVEVRVVESLYEEGYIEYDNGDQIQIGGYCIQFKVTFKTTNAAYSPKFKELHVDFYTLLARLNILTSMYRGFGR